MSKVVCPVLFLLQTIDLYAFKKSEWKNCLCIYQQTCQDFQKQVAKLAVCLMTFASLVSDGAVLDVKLRLRIHQMVLVWDQSSAMYLGIHLYTMC